MTRRSAFTLVELVVVILILGILAGVAAPKMFNTSGKATDNGLRQTLSIVRDGIELYASQHNGQLPPCSGTGGATFKTALEPYVRGAFPACPVGPTSGNTDVTANGSVGAAVAGWVYNTGTGEFKTGFNGASTTAGTYDTF